MYASSEGNEPAHVPCRRGEKACKYWLDQEQFDRRKRIQKAPNPYEAPGCLEAKDSHKRNLCHFFVLALLASEIVSWLRFHGRAVDLRDLNVRGHGRQHRLEVISATKRASVRTAMVMELCGLAFP
jgi:hypothetical protein